MTTQHHTAFHRIPIYDVRLWVATSTQPFELRKDFDWAFGKRHADDQYSATVEYDASKFLILFDTGELAHNIIAHEVFHCTHRILEHCGFYMGTQTHEPSAYLCGYITELVYADMAKWRVKVGLKMKVVPEKYKQT